MGKLIMWNLVTLDGFFEGPDKWSLDWHDIAWGDELQELSLSQLRSAAMLLFGRVTYQGMASYWPTAKGQTANLMNSLLVLGPAGSLDPSFGSNGLAAEPVDSNMDDAIALMQLADGSVLVGGPATPAGDEAVLVRFTSEGALDQSFGNGGWIQIPFDGAGIDATGAIRFGQQSDGKIVLAIGSDTGDIALARVTADGQMDPSFANGGIVDVQIAGGLLIAVESIAIGAGDEIIVAMATGTSGAELTLVRFTPDGVKDLGFAGGRLDVDRGTSHRASLMSVLEDGSVLVNGSAYETDPPNIPFLMRVTTTGSVDASFGDAGVLVIESGFRMALVEGDGAILVAGVVDGQAVFRRLTPAGESDTSFGTDGEQVIPLPSGFAGSLVGFLSGPAGLITVGRPDVTVMRFDLGDGRLDRAFGDDGTATVAIDDISAKQVVRQGDGRILVLADEDVFPFLLARFFE